MYKCSKSDKDTVALPETSGSYMQNEIHAL